MFAEIFGKQFGKYDTSLAAPGALAHHLQSVTNWNTPTPAKGGGEEKKRKKIRTEIVATNVVAI